MSRLVITRPVCALMLGYLLVALPISATATLQVPPVETKEPTKQDVSPPLKSVQPKAEKRDSPKPVKPLRQVPHATSQPNASLVAAPAPQIQSTNSLKNDVSPRLGSMSPKKVEGAPIQRVQPLRRIIPNIEGRRPSAPTINDQVTQATAPQTLVEATMDKPFPGIGIDLNGFRIAASPPDTNGVVGPNQYVQWVNDSFAIFDKTGALVYGPADGNTLFTGFGGPCEKSNDGDPVVQFDKIAERWVLSQFSVSGVEPSDPTRSAFRQCVAVSTSSDATGTYNRYEFNYADFNDYPKMAVWPDGYYVTFNMFSGTDDHFLGSKICVYDRVKMLAGQPASQQCVQLGNQFGGLLPSDLDGATASLRTSGGIPGPGLPPPNSPNFILNFGRDSLNLWTFHVDWAHPASSTLTGPTNIQVSRFNPACDSCIPQKEVSQQLDTLGDRLMFRLAYRRFSDHQSLVANHVVTTNDGNQGIRWYELRLSGQQASVFQQGTFAPDSNHRWIGSIAMDKMGNIALAYNTSSNNQFPDIRFTGRRAGATAGELQGERIIQEGKGSQTSFSRWGDYSSLSVDPVDDCRFWFTTEYLTATGKHNWSTRIVSLKFNSCQ